MEICEVREILSSIIAYLQLNLIKLVFFHYSAQNIIIVFNFFYLSGISEKFHMYIFSEVQRLE